MTEDPREVAKTPATIAIVGVRLDGTLAEIARQLGARHSLVHVSTPDAALACVREQRLALAIIADDLPQARATTLLRALLPNWSGPYVLMGDSRHDGYEHIVALESGFDDAWPHNIDARLACARAHALIRRDQAENVRVPEIVHGAGLVLDRGRRVLTYRGAETSLTPRETSALDVLLRRRGRVVERREFGTEPSSLACHRDIDAVVCRLRRKIRAVGAIDVRLAAVRGRGYTLKAFG